MIREPITLSITDILIGERIGFFSTEHAKRLGASMAEEGQHTPIQVRQNGNAAKQKWTLVAGYHRLRGAEGIGWTEITAIQVADKTSADADLRRMELAENLGQKHRRPIERAIMMAEYARLEEEIDHPGMAGETQQARGGRMKNSAAATMAAASDWRTRTAKAFGTSLRQFERHQRVYREIVKGLPNLAQGLNDHPFGESLNDMERLAKIHSVDARRTVAEMIIDPESEWETIGQVLIAAGINGDNGFRVDDRNHGAMLVTTWGKMKVSEKRKYLEEQFPNILTKDMAKKLVIRLVDRWKL